MPERDVHNKENRSTAHKGKRQPNAEVVRHHLVTAATSQGRAKHVCNQQSCQNPALHCTMALSSPMQAADLLQPSESGVMHQGGCIGFMHQGSQGRQQLDCFATSQQLLGSRQQMSTVQGGGFVEGLQLVLFLDGAKHDFWVLQGGSLSLR